MKVYRIEHETENYGPYNGKIDCNMWQSVNHTAANGRPNPYADNWIILEVTDYCGFKTLTQLKRWFTKKERSNLKKLGFVVKVFDISEDKVKLGDKQVVFKRDDAKLINSVAIFS